MKEHNHHLVSVIISFLNEERFLEEAITSVLNQDYAAWELLLVDDGSTDGSTDIALAYASKYGGKIFYCDHENHKNKGLSASRNLGIKQSNGTLIAFLDADDVWLPAKLSNQVQIFQKNAGLGMVCEASKYWYKWNKPEQDDVIIPVGTEQDRLFKPPELLFQLYPLKTGAAPCPSSLMLTKSAITKVGNFEEAFIKEFAMYEDQAFLSKIYLHEKVYISSACNNLYRQRTESIVQTVHASGKYHKVREYYLRWFRSYLKNKLINNSQLNKLLNTALIPYEASFYSRCKKLFNLFLSGIKKLYKQF